MYLPTNEFLENLMLNVSERLGLDRSIAVKTPEEMESILFNQNLVAGIEFLDLAVSILNSYAEIVQIPAREETSIRK